MLYVIVTQVTKHDEGVTFVTLLSHMSLSLSHNHVTQRRL